jgi:hypothetical protein
MFVQWFRCASDASRSWLMRLNKVWISSVDLGEDFGGAGGHGDGDERRCSVVFYSLALVFVVCNFNMLQGPFCNRGCTVLIV